MNPRRFWALPLAVMVISVSVPTVFASQQDGIDQVQSAT